MFSFDEQFANIKLGIDLEYNSPDGRMLGITTNNREVLIFNPELHGWDGIHTQEITDRSNIFEVRDLPPGAKLIIAFQYSFDDPEDFEGSGKSDLPEDYFDWVVLYSESKGELTLQFDWECA